MGGAGSGELKSERNQESGVKSQEKRMMRGAPNDGLSRCAE